MITMVCAWCRAPLSQASTREARLAAAREHAVRCPKHPAYRVEELVALVKECVTDRNVAVENLDGWWTRAREVLADRERG